MVRTTICPETEKIRYQDWWRAKLALLHVHMNADDRTERTWYLCPYCDGFHLTSQRRGRDKYRTRGAW